MSCKPIRLKDGTTLLANVAPGKKLSASDLRVLEEYAQFCRDRSAQEQRKRNAALLPKAAIPPQGGSTISQSHPEGVRVSRKIHPGE